MNNAISRTLRVICPTCKAAVGSRCFGSVGYPLSPHQYCHHARQDLVDRTFKMNVKLPSGDQKNPHKEFNKSSACKSGSHLTCSGKTRKKYGQKGDCSCNCHNPKFLQSIAALDPNL